LVLTPTAVTASCEVRILGAGDIAAMRGLSSVFAQRRCAALQ